MQLSLPGQKLASTASRSGYPYLDGWVVERPLSAGAQAEVFRVHRPGDPDRIPFVAKVPRVVSPDGSAYPAEEQQWRLAREVAALQSLARGGCPGIVTVVDSHIIMDSQTRPWYVMPYYGGGSMRRPYLPGQPAQFAENYRGQVDRVLQIAGALATTLAWMHEHAPYCIHRDVNASNVFFSRKGGPPVLGDFGIAHLQGFPDKPDSAEIISGPWFWRPPEMDCGDCYSVEPPADVFMLGGLIYEALSGGEYLPQTSYWGGTAPHERPEYSLRRYTADKRIRAVEELLRGMLEVEPGRRTPAREVAALCRAITSERRKTFALPAPAFGGPTLHQFA